MLPRICMKKPDVLEYDDDTRAWFTELKRHHMGELSMASYQANSIMEDYSQVEVGDNSLFVGIYNGHNGPNAAEFLSNHIFRKLSRLIRENNNVMREKLLREVVVATEDMFTQAIFRNEQTNPDITYAGSCCLIALIWKGTLYIANIGDSRVVLGTTVDVVHAEAEQLTLVQQFRRGSTFLLNDEVNELMVKGFSKVTGSIGDVYTKRSLMPKPELNYKSVYLPYCQPNTGSRILRYGHKFLILASSGFWEIMINEEAVSIVERHSRRDIAKTLLRKALEKVAAKEKMSYKEIVCSANRKKFHDDITIIVVFLDLDNNDKPVWKKNVPKLSHKVPSHPHSPFFSFTTSHIDFHNI